MVHPKDQTDFSLPCSSCCGQGLVKGQRSYSSGWRWESLKESSVVVKALARLLEEAIATISSWETNPCKVLPLEGAAGQLSAVHLGLATLDWEHTGTTWQGAPPPSKPPWQVAFKGHRPTEIVTLLQKSPKACWFENVRLKIALAVTSGMWSSFHRGLALYI